MWESLAPVLFPIREVERIECNSHVMALPLVFRHPPRREADLRCTAWQRALQPQTQQLELAHVLFLDIAGSSSLPVIRTGRPVSKACRNSSTAPASSAERGPRIRSRWCRADTVWRWSFLAIQKHRYVAPWKSAAALAAPNKFCLRMGLHSWPACRLDDLNLKRTVSDGGNQRSPECDGLRRPRSHPGLRVCCRPAAAAGPLDRCVARSGRDRS